MITERVEEQTVRSAIALACRAPSVHNSQPWMWRYDAHRVHLQADTRRLLPATDMRGRDLVVSCGASLHHLRVALAASGIATTVHRSPRPERPDLLATVQLTARTAIEADLRAAAVITRRRTDRRRFGDWPVPEAFLAELHACAKREGAVLHVVDRTGGGRELVLAAMREADHVRQVMTRYTTETALWTARLTGDDGIPQANLLADPTGTGGGLARPFPSGTLEQEPGIDGAALLLLGTASDDVLSQLRAGEALSAVLLHATELGLATCPLSQPLEVTGTYRKVRDVLLQGRMSPQILIRVGWAPTDPVPPTPRRPLDDVCEILHP
jgi:nitroreductase